MTQRIREAYKMLHRGAHAVVYYAQPLCSAVGTSCLIFCHAHYLCVLRVLCVSNSTAQLDFFGVISTMLQSLLCLVLCVSLSGQHSFCFLSAKIRKKTESAKLFAEIQGKMPCFPTLFEPQLLPKRRNYAPQGING